MTPRKRIVPKKQREKQEALEYQQHFVDTPIWARDEFEPVRSVWPAVDWTIEYPPSTRVSWINPGDQEVRSTWGAITQRLGLYQDLRIHPYDCLLYTSDAADE